MGFRCMVAGNHLREEVSSCRQLRQRCSSSAILVLVGLAAAAWFIFRRRSLQERFGPEYDRVVADQDSRREAERELRDRERRHTTLDIRPLDPQARERYAESWRDVQARFVEDPAGAVVAGDELLTSLMAERGYPTEDYEDRLSRAVGRACANVGPLPRCARRLRAWPEGGGVHRAATPGPGSLPRSVRRLLDGSPSEVGSPEMPPSEARRERGSSDPELADRDPVALRRPMPNETRPTREAMPMPTPMSGPTLMSGPNSRRCQRCV